jgi:hypothetical protein
MSQAGISIEKNLKEMSTGIKVEQPLMVRT